MSSTNAIKCEVALLAGSGKLPFLVLDELKRLGRTSLVLDLGCDDPRVNQLAHVHVKVTPVEVVKALHLMKKYSVSEVVMVGRVPHETLLKIKPWHLSWQVLKLWWQLADTRTDTVLKALADYFTLKGFPVISSLEYLKHCLISHFKMPSHESLACDADVGLGIAVAKTLGSVDVGQSIVIRKGTVLAVEAIEGTDRCLDRAIEIGSEGAVLVKMAKPRQDVRFDIPTIGESTFERLIRGKFRALVVEEGSTLCTDLEGLAKLQSAGIALLVADERIVKKAMQQYAPHMMI